MLSKNFKKNRRLEKDEKTILEREPLEQLARDNQLMAFKHEGFWQAMDTLRDKINLHKAWESGTPQWKIWSN